MQKNFTWNWYNSWRKGNKSSSEISQWIKCILEKNLYRRFSEVFNEKLLLNFHYYLTQFYRNIEIYYFLCDCIHETGIAKFYSSNDDIRSIALRNRQSGIVFCLLDGKFIWLLSLVNFEELEKSYSHLQIIRIIFMVSVVLFLIFKIIYPALSWGVFTFSNNY